MVQTYVKGVSRLEPTMLLIQNGPSRAGERHKSHIDSLNVDQSLLFKLKIFQRGKLTHLSKIP